MIYILIGVPIIVGIWFFFSLKKLGNGTSSYTSAVKSRQSTAAYRAAQCSSQSSEKREFDIKVDRSQTRTQRFESGSSIPMRDIGRRLFHGERNRFVAIDFETANGRYYSACSLGIVVFEQQEPIERKSYLIKPPTKFDPINIAIHGITESMVKDAPSFDKIWAEVYPYLTQTRVVMYSDFDAKVLKSLIRHFGLNPIGAESIELDCFDVCQCARNSIFGLTNYKLPTVCEYLSITGLNHHEATSDAEACGKIYCWLYNNKGRIVNASHDRQATYAQQDYIRSLGGTVPPVLSVRDASVMIDKLIEENAKRREEEYLKAKAEREEKKRAEKQAAQEAKAAEKQWARRKKEEDALKLLADEMSSPDYKMRKSRSKRVQDLKEFQVLVNKVLADSVIEVEELLQIKCWLLEHKVLDGDFDAMFKLIDATLADGKIDDVETQSLYAGMLDCMSTLRKRQIVD